MNPTCILTAASMFVLLLASPIVAQDQGQTVRAQGDGTQENAGQQTGQTERGYGRENPYERYVPYKRKPQPRVITSQSMIGLDGGEVDPGMLNNPRGNNQPGALPRNNWFGIETNGQGNAGPVGGNFGNRNTNFGNRNSNFGTNNGPRVTVSNGVRTIEVDESARKIKIVEDPQRGIYVEVTRKYGPNELASLKSRMPNLGEYIDLFPKQLDNSDIELTIDVTSKFNAANAQDLEQQDAGAYNIYRRFANVQQSNSQQQSQRRNRGGVPPGFGQPILPPGSTPRNLPSAGIGGGGSAIGR